MPFARATWILGALVLAGGVLVGLAWLTGTAPTKHSAIPLAAGTTEHHVVELPFAESTGSPVESGMTVEFAREAVALPATLSAPTNAEVLLQRGERLAHVRVENLRVFGKLVAAENGAPLAGTVKIVEGDAQGRMVETERDGRFEITAGSWDHALASAEARGRAPVVFPIEAGLGDPSSPCVLRLSRVATVQALVRDRAGAPVAGATVELVADANRHRQASTSVLLDHTFAEKRVWSGRSDEAGRVTIGGLVPSVPLRVSVSKRGSPRRDEPEPITLEAGERRCLDLVLGGGATIRGSLQVESGAPIRGRVVWRTLVKEPVPGMFRSSPEPTTTTRTDAQGHFCFRAVPAGAWWIGPAPVVSSDIPAVAEVVTVTDEGSEIDIVVRVQRGLYLRGRVLDPGGDPVGDSCVRAEWVGGHASESALSREDGSFAIGPLLAGPWNIRASGTSEARASSRSAQVQAGSADIVLWLRRGGQILGEVVDGSTGEACGCELEWGPADGRADEEGRSWTKRMSPDGSIHLGQLLPGEYTVTAHTRDGRIGRSSVIALGSGGIVEGFRIELAPGARLGLVYRGSAPGVRCSLRLDRAPIRFAALEADRPETVIVPSGTIAVYWNETAGETEHVQSITLEAGEERELVLQSDS